MNKDGCSVKKGDIFHSSWGYDQTNYEYVIVEKVSPTCKTAICRRTGHIHRGSTGQTNIQEPTPRPFGDTFRLHIQKYDNTPILRGSYPFCHDGRRGEDNSCMRLGTLWPVRKGQTFHETDPQFGH